MGISLPGFPKKQDKFLSLLIEQIEVTTRGLVTLESAIQSVEPADLEQMEKLEYEGDEVRRILIDELHKTFVTPIDREDIYNISHHIDEMLDYALSTIEGMLTFQVTADELLSRMISLNRQAAEEIRYALQRLQENPMVALEHARRARKLENEVEDTYRNAVNQLFSQATDFDTLLLLLRAREVYRHVSNMADRAHAAAHVLGMIVIKMT